tara:strand:- start:334 stop:1410 length:1077 start_codon:yes stop_codon:yes gene_type:complete
MKKTNFCPLPWIHFHAWADKKIFPCCIATEPLFKITDEQTYEDIVNHFKYVKLRKQFLNNEQPETCWKCFDQERAGNESLRQEFLRQYGDQYTDKILVNPKLKYLDIRFSNKCNLACVTCGPSFSQNLYTPYKKMGLYVEEPKIQINNLVPHIKPHLLDVESAYFAGGEPLITEQILEILQYWIDNNHTPFITVCSNLTVNLANKNSPIELLKQFKHNHFLVSLDGTNEVNKNIRLGAKFKNICNNIEILKNFNFTVQISPTISTLNVHNIPKLYHYINSKFDFNEKNWLINLVQSPKMFSITTLTTEEKGKIKQIFSNLPKSIQDKVVSYMYSSEPDLKLYKNGIKHQEQVKTFFKN